MQQLRNGQICSWTILRGAPEQLDPLLAESVTMHQGRIPSLFLPNGSIDLIVSAGSPLPTPWGAAGMLIQVKRARALHVPPASADAFRIPLEMGAYRLLIDADEPLEDGMYAAPERLKHRMETSRTGAYQFDPVSCLSALAEAMPEPRAPKARRFRETREVLQVARLGNPHTVESWSRQAGVSVRRIERMVNSSDGIRPKLFLRLLRLSRAIAAMTFDLSFCEIGDEYSFSDQSHLTRECRALTGWSPSMLREKIRARQIFSLESA
jgi:AraC-like DNA-binding protein